MDYRNLAYQTAQKYGIDPDMFVRQIQAESAFNPAAVSSAGAIGLGQLMPATAKELGVDPTDPVQNLEGAARYMKQQLDRFGDPALALAAYNAGPSRVAKAGGIPKITETQNYVAKILGGKGGASMADQPTQPQQSQGLLGGLLGGQGIGSALGLSDDFRDRLKMGLLLGSDPQRFAPMVAGMQQAAKERRAMARTTAQANATADYLERMGQTDLANLLRQGGIDAGAALKAATQVPKVSEAEKQINRLMETGIDRTTAIAIRDGRFKVSRNPVTQRAELIDMATGGIVGQATEALAQEVGAEEPAADDRFKGLPVEQAGGLVGWGASIANIVTDAVGAGQQFPNIGEAQAAMNDLSKRTVLVLDANFAGKPTNFTREIVEKLTVKPAEVTQGSTQSYQKTINMINALEEAVSSVEAALENPTQYSPQEIKEARKQYSTLRGLRDDYVSLRNAFESKGLASQGAAGGQPTVVQTDQDRALIQKYSNPNYYRDNMLPSPE